MINKEPVLAANLNVSSFDDLKNIRFTSSFNINGSGQILFTPLGKITTVKIDSKWPHPSFNGNSLPQTAQVNEHGFSAVWKSLAHNRNFPQQWKDDDYALSAQSNEVNDSQIIAAAAFGADLYVPVNAYQKTMRSIKYAILCILLTFVSFYLIETTNRKSIHPLQYALIGFALVLFYTLLLSFSEYIGFNYSYIIASLFTISLIAWFVKGLLSSSRLSIILSGVLVLIYTYIFTILQLQDYALLVGSIGLFIALGIIMHFSKKIQW
jgi:inner membrane protein